MTWLDSWQYVITWHTWHTWHDVKAWLHNHKVLYLTSSICRCEWTEAMILLLFHTVSMSGNSSQLSSFAWPQRVTLKPKVTSWSTWLLLSLLVFVLQRWIFCSFVRFSDHGNSFQLLPIAWPWRVTSNLKVTSWTTWLWLSLLVFVLQRWFFRFFVRFTG